MPPVPNENEALVKMNEIGQAFEALKEKIDTCEKNYDGLLNGQIDELSQGIAKAQEELQAVQERNEKLEVALKRQNKADGSADDVYASKMNAAFNRFARKATKSNIDFSEYLAVNEPELVSEIKAHPDYGTKSMSVAIDADGGFLVTPTLGGVIMGQQFETSPMRQLASQVTISSDAYEVVLDDDEATAGGWVGEITAPTDTATPSLGKLNFPTHEQFAQPKATQKLLDDAGVDVEAWLGEKITDILTRTENTAFITGDGVSKPRGILDYPAWSVNGTYERGKLEHIASGASGALSSDGILDLMKALKEFYDSNATFMMKRATFGDVLKLKDGENRYMAGQSDLNGTVSLIIRGKPVLFANDMQAVAANALSIAYGDFRSGYQIVDRKGVSVLRDPFTDKPYVKFYATKRTGGGVKNFEAIKIMAVDS